MTSPHRPPRRGISTAVTPLSKPLSCPHPPSGQGSAVSTAVTLLTKPLSCPHPPPGRGSALLSPLLPNLCPVLTQHHRRGISTAVTLLSKPLHVLSSPNTRSTGPQGQHCCHPSCQSFVLYSPTIGSRATSQQCCHLSCQTFVLLRSIYSCNISFAQKFSRYCDSKFKIQYTVHAQEEGLHCPNTGPHFTLYVTYSKDALLDRE